MKLGKIYQEDCLETMRRMPDDFIDLVLTSPPYDNLRDYDNPDFDFKKTAKSILRVVKKGGMVVWVVGDQTKDFDKTGTSFRQALYFKEIGFKLFDVIIYKKNSGRPIEGRYTNVFEYMFVFSKGKPKTKNILRVKTKYYGSRMGGRIREKDGSFSSRANKPVQETTPKTNIWEYNTGLYLTTKDKIAFGHPAMFPESLAKDHILSWTNQGDLVYDPFMGAGTTAKIAILLSRKWIGSEISLKYCHIASNRITPYLNKLF